MQVIFADKDGAPLRGAVTAVTAAPVELPDIGYVTDEQGAIILAVPERGQYDFILTGSDGGQWRAKAMLRSDDDVAGAGKVSVTAQPVS